MPRKPKKPGRIKIVIPPPEHPWDRQPGETDHAWPTFVAYRDQPPGERSLAKLAQRFDKSRQFLGQWSSKWEWVARCHAYDAWRDRQARAAEAAAVKAMRERHIQMAMSFQGAAALALNKIIAAEKTLGPDGKPGPLTLKPSEVKDLAELGVKLERLNRGEPEAIVEERVVPNAEPSTPHVVHDFSGLTRDELKAMRALADKARRRGK